MPNHLTGAPLRRYRGSRIDNADTVQLKIMLWEKIEKIAELTTDFDDHQADFWSTINTLKLASTDTEKFYEWKLKT